MFIDTNSILSYTGIEDIIRVQFLNERTSGDSLCIAEELTIESSLLGFLDTLRDIIKKADPQTRIMCLRGHEHNSYQIVTPELLVQISWQADGDIAKPVKAVFQITITGNPDTAKQVVSLLRTTYPDRLARVRWWYMAGVNLNCHDVVLQKPTPIQPEYYPFMNDPDEFMRGYLAHNAALLFLSGPAGTGKTTLLRNFLYRNQLRAVVTYEDVLLNSDQMFVDFVTSANHDVMIIEDADVMLGSREHSGNKMIARFLNASDGIIQLENKKIIFTTNLSNFNDVDEALVRPGRSYGDIMFRHLTPQEATAAARAAGISDWVQPDSDISLAEVFNPPNSSAFGKRAVGFTP